jgi:tetratricopeptide (TPR) repeat protein
LVGGISIGLGYRLFTQALGKPRKAAETATGAEMEARFGESQLTLKNAAPGTFFVVFGAAIVIAVLAGSPPAFSFKTQTGGAQVFSFQTDASADPAGSGQAPAAPLASATEITLRSPTDIPESAEAAHKLAVEQFQYLLKLEERAAALEPQNPEYLDSLAGLYFLAGKFDLALQHQEKAVQLAPQREDIQKRLAAYRLAGQKE